MTTPFWSNDPTILFNKSSMFQVWPSSSMTVEAKMNAISRLVIILSTLGFILTMKTHFLIIGAVTLAIIFSIYRYRKQTIVSGLKENFTQKKKKSQSVPAPVLSNPVTLENVLRSEFHPTTKKNPFGNVLLTDIMDDPNRLAAAPSFNPAVSDEITSAVKKQTQMLYPGIKSTNKQLYGDLYDNFQLDTDLMQRFYSTANTRVDSDQNSYAMYLYGNMPSGKDSGPEGAFARVQDNYRYILI
jgi:hypothetical protein